MYGTLPLDCVGSVGDAGDDARGLEGLLYVSWTHQVLVWTMLLDGRREIVGMEAVPRTDGHNADLVADWALPRYRYLAANLGERISPMPSALLREELQFRRVMRDRADLAQRSQAITDAIPGPYAVGVLSADGQRAGAVTREEMAELEHLLDAVTYVTALQEGASPVTAIMERRTISQRTAEGRIAKARRLGLLSPAPGKRAGGHLTAKAERMLGQINTSTGSTDEESDRG